MDARRIISALQVYMPATASLQGSS